MIINIFQIICYIVIIISSINIIKWYISNKQNEKILQDISSVVELEKNKDNENKYNIAFNKLKEKNEDSVGYIKVNGTDIAYVVVKGKDNSYYLSHNFEQKSNGAGWIFADFRNKLDGSDKNLIIYGHNRKDGSMFGSLKNVLNKDWYDNLENRKIIFITENEESIYEVFSVYSIEKEDYYIQTDFYEGDFDKFVEKIKRRSIKEFGIEVGSEDKILTLSTCDTSSKYRVVLHAKLEKSS